MRRSQFFRASWSANLSSVPYHPQRQKCLSCELRAASCALHPPVLRRLNESSPILKHREGFGNGRQTGLWAPYLPPPRLLSGCDIHAELISVTKTVFDSVEAQYFAFFHPPTDISKDGVTEIPHTALYQPLADDLATMSTYIAYTLHLHSTSERHFDLHHGDQSSHDFFPSSQPFRHYHHTSPSSARKDPRHLLCIPYLSPDITHCS